MNSIKDHKADAKAIKKAGEKLSKSKKKSKKFLEDLHLEDNQRALDNLKEVVRSLVYRLNEAKELYLDYKKSSLTFNSIEAEGGYRTLLTFVRHEMEYTEIFKSVVVDYLEDMGDAMDLKELIE